MAFADDLLSFLTSVPTSSLLPPYVRRLFRKGKYEELREIDDWDLIPNKAFLFHKDSFLAFRIANRDSALLLGCSTATNGFTIAPSDGSIPASPIGSPVPLFWTGRDLRAIGEVIVRDSEKVTERRIWDSEKAIGTIATVKDAGPWMEDLTRIVADGRPLPVVVGVPGASLVKRIAESGISEEDVIDYSLQLIDAQPPQIVGADRALVCGPGLDWLVGAYAAVQAFLKGEGGTAVLIVAEDLGAGWIGETLDRVFGADLGRILAKSVYVNVQAVDARPPVWRNCPRTIGIGQGVAILTAPSRSGTDLGTREIVNHAGQKICVRTRLVSEKVEGEKTLGLTGGAVVGAKLGVAAVDIGVPVLGSGSARLTAAVADVEAATRLLTELSENIDEHKQALY